MPRCPSCSREVPEGLFCLACGKPLLTSSEIPTELMEPARAPARLPAAPPAGRTPVPTPAPASAHGRFLPGALLAGRYRIVALAGRGGMGEVYRADDLKLGQPVALKFLPEELERDGNRLERFMNEVRTARQVAHPNVCRVYDVGEIEGHHFLSMEYVDGEDLASLLRRIGRLPSDKGVEIARQISAGLAAAHDAGVLHRDLKPANVMIDGRGRARITDFGLAALGAVEEGEEARFGTPAYMAPEQLAGKEVTPRSDVYALGLVLYELFTGKPPFKASSRTHLHDLQTGSTPAAPSSLVGGVDPAVERVILRCLEPEPSQRPASALAVVAALPGGDPLAAAIAAGETPSPELVAAAGESGGLTPGVAAGITAAILAGVVLIVFLASRTQLVRMVSMTKPPAVLAEKAREVLAGLGYTEPATDRIGAFQSDAGAVEHRRGGARGEFIRGALDRSAVKLLHFRYRQSPRYLGRDNGGSIGDWFTDPPATLPGMTDVSLDLEGRLIEFAAVPPGRLWRDGEPPEPDWTRAIAAAGFDPAGLTPVEPVSVPPVFADQLAAWEGHDPAAPEVPILVEAAAFGGRVTTFRVGRMSEIEATDAGDTGHENIDLDTLVRTIVFLIVLTGTIFLARRNLRQGRCDTRSAFRFAVYLGVIRLLWMLGAHHTPTGWEFHVLIGHVAWSMYRVGMVALMYLALEPYARRLWPRMLTSWTRLCHGRLRDPLVGRDILAGCALGVFGALTTHVNGWLASPLGVAPPPPLIEFWTLESLRGVRHAVTALIAVHSEAVLGLFIPLTFFLLLTLGTRRVWLAVAITTLLGLAVYYPGSGNVPLYTVSIGIGMVFFWISLFRFGFLSVMVAATVGDLLRSMPLTFDVSAPYAGTSVLTLATVTLVVLFAFRTSLAGRPLFRDAVLGTEPAR